MWTKPTTAKTENAGAGGVELAREVRGAEVAQEVREADEIADKSAGGGEVWSLESLCELEKRTKLLINPPEELKSGRSRVCVSSRSGRNC